MDDGSDRDDGPDGWPDAQPGGSEDDQQYAPTSNQVSMVVNLIVPSMKMTNLKCPAAFMMYLSVFALLGWTW